MGHLRRDIDELEPERRKSAAHRSCREYEYMLVIDRIVGCFRHHIAEVWILEYEYTIAYEQTMHASGDARQIGNVTHHIGRQDRVGATMFGGNVIGELAVEKGA